MRDVDVRNLACPGPVMELKRLLEAGERELRMLVADELARSNVSRFATSRGAGVEQATAEGGGFAVLVRAGDQTAQAAARASSEELACDLPSPATGPLVVQVTSEAMGHGEPELGALLLRSFLKTQIELQRRPDAIVFYNTGVRLCCRGSLLVEDLQRLQATGVEVIACGTCLSYLGLAAELAVGRVTDMLEIASRLAGAGHIVRP